ncbi:MAG: DUF3365 domain-containing protein [Porticoccaceae bacterium]
MAKSAFGGLLLYSLLLMASCPALCGGNPDAISTKEISPEEAELTLEAESLVQQFAGTLKPQLQAAMQQGGPVHAINVCAEVAPRIARQLSDSSGWQVKRVSLKARNSGTAVPDSWEREILQQFDQRRAAGELPQQLTVAAAVDGKFRYMKAQGVEPLCLTCHGETLDPQVRAALQQRYPDDQATGYREGQIRGAFSLSKSL